VSRPGLRSLWNVVGVTDARKYATPNPTSVSIVVHFAELSDPRRREGNYPLINFVVMAVRKSLREMALKGE
jgi:hypothetical protein